MESLFLLYAFATYQLAVAVVNIDPVTISGDTPNSCPSREKLERASEILCNSSKDVTSKMTDNIPWCGDGIWYQLISINNRALTQFQ